MKLKRILLIIGIVLLMLLVPYVAMHFSSEVNWTLSDFVIAGMLLLVTGVSIEMSIRKIKNRNIRVGVVVAILICLGLIWGLLATM